MVNRLYNRVIVNTQSLDEFKDPHKSKLGTWYNAVKLIQ